MSNSKKRIRKEKTMMLILLGFVLLLVVLVPASLRVPRLMSRDIPFDPITFGCQGNSDYCMSTVEQGMYQQQKSREEHASSEANFCQEVTELRLASIDSQAAASRPEIKGDSFRKASTGGFARNRNDVHELLDCTVCMNLMHPPIYQCANGHTLCSICKARVQNCCPTCRHELGNIRCLALEKVAESLELPCAYENLGCIDMFPYHSKLKHEKNCKYRPFNCPYAGGECSVTGDIPYLVMHLKDNHEVDMHDGCSFSHRYVKSNPQEVENATWMLTVFNCFGRQFCLHFEAFRLGTAPVYMAFLRFMGDDDDAKQFSYSLEVGGNGRKLIWQGIPRSIRDSHRKVRDSHDGLIIQRKMAQFCSGNEEQELKLKVTGRIWRVK